MLAVAGPWDFAIGLLTLVGTVVVAVVGLRTNARAKNATAEVARVQAAVGNPNGMGSISAGLERVHERIAAVATTTAEHATQDARFHDEARVAFDRQLEVNAAQADLNASFEESLVALRAGIARLERQGADLARRVDAIEAAGPPPVDAMR